VAFTEFEHKIIKLSLSLCLAPEVVSMEPYGHAVDWWSLGVVACCMLSGQVGLKKQYLIHLPLVLSSVILVVAGESLPKFRLGAV
jgi:serine/threonine protein kinase